MVDKVIIRFFRYDKKNIKLASRILVWVPRGLSAFAFSFSVILFDRLAP